MQRAEEPFGITAKNRLHSGSVQLLSTNEVSAKVIIVNGISFFVCICDLFIRFFKKFEQQLYTIMTVLQKKSV